jgi:hypothetical protein
MRVTERIRAERLSADQAYERFFDGYYNLGAPGEVFQGTMVLSPPPRESAGALRPRRIHRERVPRKVRRHAAR